ncbi:MAG TPA: hypothetical protein VI160_10865 [Gemmatimonadales bacterium]
MPPPAEREREATRRACAAALDSARCAARLAGTICCDWDVGELLRVVLSELGAAEAAVNRMF